MSAGNQSFFWFSPEPRLTAGDSNGAFTLAGVLSPQQITGNQDNYAPAGIKTASILRLSTDASRNITGIAASQRSGRILLVVNVGSNPIVLQHDVTSLAANRFYNPGLADITLAQYQSVMMEYDATLTRWIVSSPPQTLTHASATVSTSQTTTSTSYTDLATTGPTITLSPGKSSDMFVGVGAAIVNNGSNQSLMSPSVAGATPTDDQRSSSTGTNLTHCASRYVFHNAIASGSTAVAKYRVTGGTGTFDGRSTDGIAL